MAFDFSSAILDNITRAGPTELREGVKVIIGLHGVGGNDGKIQEFILGAFGGSAPPDTMVISPSAAAKVWWPPKVQRALEPDQKNYVDACTGVTDLIRSVLDQGVRAQDIFIVGHSQGACLAAEILTRMDDQRFGLVMILSGGLLGEVRLKKAIRSQFPYWNASLKGANIYIAGQRDDPITPVKLVRQTSNILERRCKAEPTLRIGRGGGHNLMKTDQSYLARAFAGFPSDAV